MGQAGGRACGTCNLCCSVLEIAPLAKPVGDLCRHALPGNGCAIHGAHPEVCKGFHCEWIRRPDLGDEWFPATAHFLLRLSPDGRSISVDVDADHPDAWRSPAYYPTIKAWARAAVANQGQVIVNVGYMAIAIFPEEDLEVGDFRAGDQLMTAYRLTPAGRRPLAKVTRADGSVVERLGAAYPR